MLLLLQRAAALESGSKRFYYFMVHFADVKRFYYYVYFIFTILAFILPLSSKTSLTNGL